MYLVEAELVVGVRLGKAADQAIPSSYSNFITYSNRHTYISERLVFPPPPLPPPSLLHPPLNLTVC